MPTYLTTWSDNCELWLRAESLGPAIRMAEALRNNTAVLIGVHEREASAAPSLEWDSICGLRYILTRNGRKV